MERESGSFVDRQLTDFPQRSSWINQIGRIQRGAIALLKGEYQLRGRMKGFDRREVSSGFDFRGRSVRLSRVEEVVARYS